MSSRKGRRAEMFKARKAARKAGFVNNLSSESSTAPAEPPVPATDAENQPSPPPSEQQPKMTNPISEARQAANQANAKKSHGALTPETKATSAQNHTIHGLARHQNGNFKILAKEDPAVFASLKQSLWDEHQPATPTEVILVSRMIESEWLAQRALRLQESSLDPETGIPFSDQKFSVYCRYQTTHVRAFHKCLADLNKMRAEKRKAECGVEAQRAKQAKEKLENERHEMKKVTHIIETFQKDVTAQHDLTNLTLASMKHDKEVPGFYEKYTAALAKHGLDKDWWEVKAQAA